MRLKTVAVLLVSLGLLALGLYLGAERVLGSDLVRSSVEQQLSASLGQPVRIDSASASVFPRVALKLKNLEIGRPVTVRFGEVRIVTGLRGLFSRRVEDAEVVIAEGRIALPLPFALTPAVSAPLPAPEASAAFTVRSIRHLEWRGVALVANDRSVQLDVESSVDGDRLHIARLTVRAKTTRIEASGDLNSIARLEGALEAKADPLDLDELIAIGAAFTGSPTPAPAPAVRSNQAAAGTPMRLTLKLTATGGQFASYPFRDLSTTVDLAPGTIALAPLSVGTFGGKFQGRVEAVTSRALPHVTVTGRLDGIDVGELMKAAGSTGGLTGRLAGTVSLAADGTDSATLTRTARGKIAAAVTDGAMPGLDMVRTIVLAFGKPSGAPPQGSGSRFSRLDGTFALANGTVTSDNLALASRDFDMHGRGTLKIATGGVDARADVVLSEELTAQAGTDLRRYAQENGRVTVPATISGELARPNVSIDVAAATRRALGNELQRRAKSLFGDLFKKKKGGG